MTDLSRRRFITRASLGVAASVAAASGLSSMPALLGPATASAEPAKAPPEAEPEPDLSAVGEDVVAHVTNASTGEVTVLVGTTEIVHHDRQLVGRLLGAARRATLEG